MGQAESAPAPTATESRPRPTSARPTSMRQDSGSYAPLSTSYPPENEPVPEPWPLGLFSSLSLRPTNPPPSTQNPKPPSSTSLPSSSLGSSSFSTSSSSSTSFFSPPPPSSSTSALSSSSTSPPTSLSYPSQPARQRRRSRRASTTQVLSQPPAPSSWRRIGREDDLSEDEEVSDEDEEISRGDNRNAPQPYRGTGSLILPGPPGPSIGPPSASYSKGRAQPPSQPVRGPPPSAGPYPGYSAGRGYAQAVGTPSRGSQPPNRIQMAIRPGAPSRGSAAQRNVAQSRAVTEQQQALQAMGIPLEMVDQLLSGDGDLDEEAFNRLVLLTTALQPQQDKGVPPHVLDSLPQITYSSASIVEVSEKSCVVCLEDFEEQETLIKLPQCVHAFHRQCIRSWLVEKASCPVCRTPVE